MKSPSLILVVILFWIFSGCSCRKDSVSDTVVINGITFSARINGVTFIPDKYDVSFPPLRIIFWGSQVTGKTDLQIIAEKNNEFLEVWIPSPVTSGIKMLKFNTQPYPILVSPENYGLYHINNPLTSYMTNSLLGGYIDILRVDTLQHKIEARFEFTGTDKNTNNKVTVTNGLVKNY